MGTNSQSIKTDHEQEGKKTRKIGHIWASF